MVFCVEYRCNNHCDICMLKGSKKTLKPVDFITFKNLLIKYRDEYPEKKGIIFSGGEVTINRDLFRFASYAKKSGFSKIMIQTNGRKLSSYDTAKDLLETGINEFFISIHGIDKKACEKMTGNADSYRQTMEGLKNLNELRARVITNTVVNMLNYKMLPEISQFFTGLDSIRESHFWDLLAVRPFQKNRLIVPYTKSIPYLKKAIKTLEKNHKHIVLKYFPECLLASNCKYLDNSQPYIYAGISDDFWENLKSCRFKKCTPCSFKGCEGSPIAHRKEFPQINPARP